MFNEAQILTDLNPILREAIVNHNCRELVDSVPFFSRADPEFVASLVRRLKFCHATIPFRYTMISWKRLDLFLYILTNNSRA